MGVLESDRGHAWTLWADTLVGRSPDASLRLEHAAVSWRHASIRWTGRAWELQDLASRNGTLVDGTRVNAGERVLLRIGQHICFGANEAAWLVVDVDPPGAVATALDDGSRITPVDGLIALPSQDAPEVSLYTRPDGTWIAEAPDRVWEPQRDEVVIAAGRRYRFEPGDAVHATAVGYESRVTTAKLELEFTVSRNEEQVDVSILCAGQRTALRPRAHHYLLLTLARARLQDQTDNTLPSTSHGWIEQPRLMRMLATSLSQLTLDIYRARRQFADAGVADSAQIVERRTTSRELRIGVERIAISVQ
ncbi:MAG: FHA domain-containing protein [Polyangiales bacterium]